jgi:hypothetical protein
VTIKELQRLKEWTRQVTRGQRESAVFMNLWSDTMARDPSGDPVPVMQLGYAMLLDKPIVIVAPHGSKGVPRVYDGSVLPVLYPGEMARPEVQPIPMARLARGPVEVIVTGWIVEPAPGWHAWWLRVRWRIWGRWFYDGEPRLLISSTGNVSATPPSVGEP